MQYITFTKYQKAVHYIAKSVKILQKLNILLLHNIIFTCNNTCQKKTIFWKDFISSNLITSLEKKLGSERKQQKNLAVVWKTEKGKKFVMIFA